MGRSFLFLIFCAGLFGTMASNFELPAPRKEATAKTQIVDPSPDPSSSQADAGTIASLSGQTIIERSPDGHFYADVDINGATIHALVDTGASRIALTRDDARAAGIALSIGMNEVIGRGADGDIRGENIVLDRVSLGSASVEGISAIVLNSGQQTLLGQNFLSQFASVRIEGDRMVLS
jgi:aspartyl protease family protein